jgi:hypothetical protein
MLIIWLQGIWLPLHGYDYADTPLWAGIYMLPLTVGFLSPGRSPATCPTGSARGCSPPAAAGDGASFAGCCCSRRLQLLGLRALIFLNGSAAACSRRRTRRSIMSSVPANMRGAASGMRATFQNAGMVLSIGVFFSLMVAGLATRCRTR